MIEYQFTNRFIKELDWEYNFTAELPHLLAIANQTPQWHSSENDNEQFCKITANNLLKIDIFKKINNQLIKNKIWIDIGILRKIKPFAISAIHTDWPGLYTALNIPLLNSKSAITSWYNFDNDLELKSLESVASKLPADSPFRLTKDKDQFLKFKIFEFTMSTPVLFNTSIPHNVQSIDNVERIILSLQFRKNAAQHLNWDDNILFDNISITR
jgi:hypothetical protein